MLRWLIFHVLVLFFLLLDLGLFHRKKKELSLSQALWLSGFWIAVSLVFNGLIYLFYGEQKALEFFTGYILEKSLSIDNIFVFVLIFSYFKISSADQHRVLYKGIIGALVFRLTFILGGLELIRVFDWFTYLFALILGFTGFRLILQKDAKVELENNWLIRLGRKIFPLTTTSPPGRFFIRQKGVLYATPLFLVLLAVEGSDILFALDSIPAIFGVTHDPFIIYTSNVFAILGLRTLYFVLDKTFALFCYLKGGLGLILLFISGKMFLEPFYPLPLGASLLVILLILALTAFFSLLKRQRKN